MEKISGILPSSQRVTSVDLRESAPVRPGTPGFGRAEGVSSLRDAKVGQTADRAGRLNKEQLDWRSKDMQNAATVRELSDKFFKGNQKPAIGMDAGPSTVERVVEDEMNLGPTEAARPSNPAGFSTPSMEFETEVAQPDGLHPRGSFIDVRA